MTERRPPTWVLKRVLLGPPQLRRIADRKAPGPKERWILWQPRSVRASYVREVLENRGNEEAWMLRQPDEVRESYVRDVLGG